MQLFDRRRNRSARSFEALQLFLDAARERLGVRALALGTPDGRLIAGAGHDLEPVAYRGALMNASDGGQDADIATWCTHLGEDEVVLTSCGRAMSADLAEGIRRILAA